MARALRVVPILRIFSGAEAHTFYLDSMGCRRDGKHRDLPRELRAKNCPSARPGLRETFRGTAQSNPLDPFVKQLRAPKAGEPVAR